MLRSQKDHFTFTEVCLNSNGWILLNMKNMGKLVFTVNCCRLVIYLSKVCVTLKKLFISNLLSHPPFPGPLSPPPLLVHTQFNTRTGDLCRFFSTIFFGFSAIRLYIVCTHFLYRQGGHLEHVPSTLSGLIVSEIFLKWFVELCSFPHL